MLIAVYYVTMYLDVAAGNAAGEKQDTRGVCSFILAGGDVDDTAEGCQGCHCR